VAGERKGEQIVRGHVFSLVVQESLLLL
jgi:hypothetical protein